VQQKLTIKDIAITSSGAWQRSATSSSVKGSTGSLQLKKERNL